MTGMAFGIFLEVFSGCPSDFSLRLPKLESSVSKFIVNQSGASFVTYQDLWCARCVNRSRELSNQSGLPAAENSV